MARQAGSGLQASPGSPDSTGSPENAGSRENPSGTKTPDAAGNDRPGKRTALLVDTLSKAFFGRTSDEQYHPTPQKLPKNTQDQGALDDKGS